MFEDMHVCLDKACDCGLADTLSLGTGQQSWGSALPNQNNTIQHKLICHNYLYPAKTMT